MLRCVLLVISVALHLALIYANPGSLNNKVGELTLCGFILLYVVGPNRGVFAPLLLIL